jgi:hypothetical protein
MRLKHKFANKKLSPVTSQLSSVLTTNIWKIATEAVLDLEIQDFDTRSQNGRLDVITEYIIFMLCILDRKLYYAKKNNRDDILKSISIHLANVIDDNRQDFVKNDKNTDFKGDFISLLNMRLNDYSDFSFDQKQGSSFPLKRLFAENVSSKMGDKNNKWIGDFIIDQAVYDIESNLAKISPLYN